VWQAKCVTKEEEEEEEKRKMKIQKNSPVAAFEIDFAGAR
jgi:hypothetical protein